MKRILCWLVLVGLLLAVGQATPARGQEKNLLQSYVKRAVLAKYVIWDGKRFGGGGSWAQGGRCSVNSTEGHETKKSIEFHGEGGAWMGCGYNFFNWYPPESKHDISSYEFLSFWIKVEAAPGKGPNGLTVALNCSLTRKGSQTVQVADYCPEYADGQWHEVVIPLKHLNKDGFDVASTWEISLGQWSQDTRNFSVYVTEIAADNRAKP